MPLAQACKEHGHDVTFATGGPLLDRLPVETVKVYDDRTLDEAEAEVIRRHPDLENVPPEEKWRFGLELFADVEYDGLWKGVEPLIAGERPDLVIFEAYSAAAGVAAATHDVPAVAVGVSPWSFFFELLHRSVMERHGVERRHAIVADFYLDIFPPSTWSDDPPGLPERRPLRPVAWSPGDSELPNWLERPRQRPRVYVTLGTVVFGYTAAFDSVLAALGELDVEVLLTVGPKGDPSVLARHGEHIHVERFVDQARVIPLVDAVVHHGGSGTALAATAAGLPQVVMPQGADQFQNAEQLAAMGVARGVLPGTSDDELAEHLRAALTDDGMKAAARKFADEIAAMPSPADVAGHLEALTVRR